ncbi:hypothetical protein TD95_004364 [Thielaviopsis punctulata]|uniref:Mannan endo-1,6-alpha-mannosidase n=1 Tax=Thielaviopsis punctulata TaxID=72032 RepID=A0A0F4ZJJ4_9PEZI|nr:hypothetical protein TD95_004364 [Thielaviopsis punctulata]
MPQFFKSILSVSQATQAAVAVTAGMPPITLSVDDASSVKAVARTLAEGVMGYYQPNNSAILVGDLPDPYYWWEAGAMWGAMLDYYYYTNDSTYNDQIITALTAKVNTGTNFDFVPVEHASEEGNDDLGFWAFAVMAAAERNFPQPDASVPSWLQLGKNIFSSLESRWNTSACAGGLLWQIYASNPNGLNYKNSVSNGGFFQLAARLARVTGDQMYLDWATKIWDWSAAIGMIGTNYIVFDGAHASANCTDMNPVSFSYSNSIYMYGAAVMANTTGDPVWADRAASILKAVSTRFFYPDANATNVMYESACETVNTCNTDMKSFKAYMSRFMWQSTQMLPSLKPNVTTLLRTSALAAARTCTGGESASECGMRWYVGGFDNNTGLGQQMSALETVQGLLIDYAAPPLKGDAVQVVRDEPWTSGSAATTAATATTTTSSTTIAADPTSETVITPAVSSTTSVPATTTSSAAPAKRSTTKEGASGIVQVNKLALSLAAAAFLVLSM